MIILNYDKNEIFKLDVPKLNGPKLNIKHKKQNNNYFVIPFILIIGFLFNYKTLKVLWFYMIIYI